MEIFVRCVIKRKYIKIFIYIFVMLSSGELILNGPLYASYRNNGNMVHLGKLLSFEKHPKHHEYFFEKIGALRISIENISKPIFLDISPSFCETIDECVETCCLCWPLSEYNIEPLYSSK